MVKSNSPILGHFKAIEGWKSRHDSAMRCRDVESQIEMCLVLLSQIRAAEKHFSNQSANDATFPETLDPRLLDDMYDAFLRASRNMVAEAEMKEKEGFDVTGIDSLRAEIAAVEKRGCVAPKRIANADLLKLAKMSRPPQSWYDEVRHNATTK